MLHRNCIYCGDEFEAKTKRSNFCGDQCRLLSERSTHREKTIKNANDRWLQNIERKKSKYSLSQLTKIAEWKRIHDDESWLHRFKGSRM